MNLTRSRHISKTCACNSCVFKSEEPGEVIGNGSRIDRLYHDKYLPLRERKLLDKLVRTRGVYDDIRNRILSLSSVDITKDRELEDSQSFKPESDSDASSAVHKLVDLVDRGEYPPLISSVHLHSDCCGCCICSSKTRIQKHYKVHMHIPDQAHINQYVESHRGKMRKDTRKVGFRAARSDPCMCTLKFSKTPRKSKNVVKKYRSKDNVLIKPVAKKAKFDQKPIDVKKCECTYEAVKPSLSKKSIVLLRNAENKVRDSIRSTVTKIENVFRIKKDSLMIFRDKLKKKQAMNAWECDSDFCIPGECNPDDCYEKVKRREANKMQLKAHHHHIPDIKKAHKVKQTQIPPKQKHEHELKRCFCTQELHKPLKLEPKKPQSIKPKKEIKAIKAKKTSRTTMTKSKAKIICKCEVKESVTTQTKKKSLVKQTRKETLPIETVPVIQRKPHDLLPYECEPLFCVPGECNPLVCEERIKHRHRQNKIMSKDTNTLEMPQKTKIQTRLPSHRKRTPKPNPLHEPIAEKSNSAPNAPRKQAVRISSSFRFDVEFFKEKHVPDSFENTDTAEKKSHTEKSVQKNIEEYIEQTKNTSFRDEKLNMKEQKNSISITPRSSSGKSQEQTSLNPFLKRCLCTLKLHKTPKQKQKQKLPKSKMTMPAVEIKSKVEQVLCKCKKMNIDCICEPDNISSKSQASMTTAVVNYVVPPTNHSPNLLPYECEPLFCTPGECNPTVCEKRIKARNRKRPKTASKEINTEPKKSTRTITSKSATSNSARKIQVPKRKKAKTKEEVKIETYKTPQADKSKSAPSAPRRQAVKISSNFRFDIEFYKDRTPPNDANTIQKEEHLPKDKDIKEVKKKIRHKSAGENQPPKKVEIDSQPNRRIKSTLAITEPITRCLCHLKLKKKPKPRVKKTVPKKTMTTNIEPVICECKSISTQTKKVHVKPPIPQRPGLLPYECEPNFCIPGKCDPLICNERIKMRNKKEEDKEPLLKRCFCTLKFHNDSNAKGNRTVNPLQADLEVTSVKAIGTDTNKIKHLKKGKHKLLPYECEPGVCEPGQCDPFECLKLMKKRNMLEVTHQAKYANTERPKIKSAFSGSKHASKVQKTQYTEVKVAKEEDYARKAVSPVKSRQSVKLSSEFSFDIEFRKNKKGNEAPTNDNKPSRKITIKPKMGVKLTKGTREGRQLKNSITQATETHPNEDKSLAIETKLDRCFCTLKLHKKGHRPKNQVNEAQYMKPLGHQQIYFVNENVSAGFLRETNVSPRECTPCLCIATKLKKL